MGELAALLIIVGLVTGRSCHEVTDTALVIRLPNGAIRFPLYVGERAR